MFSWVQATTKKWQRMTSCHRNCTQLNRQLPLKKHWNLGEGHTTFGFTFEVHFEQLPIGVQSPCPSEDDGGVLHHIKPGQAQQIYGFPPQKNDVSSLTSQESKKKSSWTTTALKIHRFEYTLHVCMHCICLQCKLEQVQIWGFYGDKRIYRAAHVFNSIKT